MKERLWILTPSEPRLPVSTVVTPRGRSAPRSLTQQSVCTKAHWPCRVIEHYWQDQAFMTTNDKTPISSCLLMTFHGASAAPVRPMHPGTRTGLHRESGTASGPNAAKGSTGERTVQASDGELYLTGEKPFHFYMGDLEGVSWPHVGQFRSGRGITELVTAEAATTDGPFSSATWEARGV